VTTWYLTLAAAVFIRVPIQFSDPYRRNFCGVNRGLGCVHRFGLRILQPTRPPPVPKLVKRSSSAALFSKKMRLMDL